MLRKALLASLALVALCGCDVEGRYDERFVIDSFARLESGLVVWFAEPDQEIVLVAPVAGGIDVRRLFVPQDGERIVRLEVGPDPGAAQELFVFTAPIDEREIEIVEVEGRNIYVKLQGACHGCMMEQATLGGIQSKLAEALNEMVRVLPVSQHKPTGH